MAAIYPGRKYSAVISTLLKIVLRPPTVVRPRTFEKCHTSCKFVLLPNWYCTNSILVTLYQQKTYISKMGVPRTGSYMISKKSYFVLNSEIGRTRTDIVYSTPYFFIVRVSTTFVLSYSYPVQVTTTWSYLGPLIVLSKKMFKLVESNDRLLGS